MKQVIVAGPGIDELKVVDAEPVGSPRSHEIRVRLRASSLNFHDLAVAMGFIPVQRGRIPLSDGAGEIVDVGSEVVDFKPGDRVVSTFFPRWQSGAPTPESHQGVPGDHVDGYARSEVVAPAGMFTRVPADWSHVEAATLPCAALTAWTALTDHAHVKPGDSVLVIGTGGVSLFALQFAKAAGARVYALSSSAGKLARLKEMGADVTINYRETPEWGSAIAARTGGKGVDHVMEVGGAGTFGQSLNAVSYGGNILVIGILSGVELTVPVTDLFLRQNKLLGIGVGSRRNQMDMIAAIEANGIKPVVDKVFPLEELAAAFRYQQSGQQFGKIAISLD